MTATLDAGPGLQSDLSVSSLPVIGNSGAASKPHVWAWIWFVVAVLIILGFHIRVFGTAIPPGANFP